MQQPQVVPLEITKPRARSIGWQLPTISSIVAVVVIIVVLAVVLSKPKSKPKPTKYSCNTAKLCTEDPTGTFPTPDCGGTCTATSYSCDTTGCIPYTGIDAMNKADCEQACQAPKCTVPPDTADECWTKTYGSIYNIKAPVLTNKVWDTTDSCFDPPPKGPFLPKTVTPAGRAFRLGLWHEQVPWLGSHAAFPGETMFKAYCESMVAFVVEKNISRCFFLMGNPDDLNNYTYCAPPNPTGAYNPNSFDLLIKHWMAKLPNDVEMGILFDSATKYPWSWQSTIPGGWANSNPTTKTPDMRCDVLAKNDKGAVQNFFDWTAPVFNGACPNNLQSAMSLLKLLQERVQFARANPSVFDLKAEDLTTTWGTLKSVSCASIDFESEGGPYGYDIQTMQTWKDARKTFCSDTALFPYSVLLGTAGNFNGGAPEMCADERYPEWYWFNDLGQPPTVVPGFCDAVKSKYPNVCNADGSEYTDHLLCGGKSKTGNYVTNARGCTETVYNKYHTAADMLNLYWGPAFSLVQDALPLNGGVAADSSYWPMISVENINSVENTQVPLTGNEVCADQCFGRVNNDRCGTFRGLGSWEWAEFYALACGMVDKYALPNVCIYAWQFIPVGWMGTKPTCVVK